MSEFRFKDQVIYILSPEKWGKMRFSKHHYASELANLGNKVYFIEPPDLNNKGITLQKSEENDFLTIVSYKPVYRGKRFLPQILYRALLQLQINLLIKEIGARPDVIWCFDPFRFLNLGWFKARVKIFFLADLLSIDAFPEEALTADFCLGLSDSRMAQLKKGPKPAHFINHGLSTYYADKARQRLKVYKSQDFSSGGITVGYIGNLMMEALDRVTMKEIIHSHPQVRFIFWGQYEKGGQLVAYDKPEVFEFISFLKDQPNVTLRGAVHPYQLSQEIEDVNIFWVCWKLGSSKVWDGSNPHKILEYLSTGKPLVSHYIDAYKGNPLIDMLPDANNQGYAFLFNTVIQRVYEGENQSVVYDRIKLALDNTYEKQIIRISKWVNLYCFSEGV